MTSKRKMWARALAAPALAIVAILAYFHEPVTSRVNFVFRDAGHFYYPYYRMQADQWGDGRVPLWNPFESGGEPLAANPTSAVFYPGKILFALLPYGAAYKWYLMGHVLLALVTCAWAGRKLGLDPSAAWLAAITYALSGFVVFQVYNVIYLVGAAWLPVALVGAFGLAREASIRSAAILSLALAMSVLGGDPQTAQGAALFALVVFLCARPNRKRAFMMGLGLMAVGFAMVHLPPIVMPALRVAWRSGSFAEGSLAITSTVGPSWTIIVVSAAALLVGLVLTFQQLVTLKNPAERRSYLLVALAIVLGVGLCAIQVLPTMEFAGQTGRASPDVPEETMAFSLHPARLAEWVVPAVFGRMLPENTRWFPFAKVEAKVWVPTLYMGLLPVLLTISALRFRRGPLAVKALTWLVIVSLWLSLGKFGGWNWLWEGSVPIDPLAAERGQRLYGDSDGLYWVFEQLVPGFRQFRYPSKILVFTTLGMSLLAGFGLQEWMTRRTKGLFWTLLGLACLGLVAAFAIWFLPFDRSVAGFGVLSSFGPFDAVGARHHVAESSFHMAWVSCSILFVRLIVSQRVGVLAPWCFVAVVAGDVAMANRWLVLTDSQDVIDSKPEVIAAIEKHAPESGMDQPYRIHRSRIYEPFHWAQKTSPNRVVEMSRWERRTAQPKYGLPFETSYAKTEGSMTLYDVEFFFAPWVVTPPPVLQQRFPGQLDQMVYYPRTGYDLWNTKYFVLPRLLVPNDPERGVFTLLFDRFGKPLPIVSQSPPQRDDYVVLENTEAMPRAWLVHEVEIFPEIHDMTRAERSVRTERLVFRPLDAGIRLWEGTLNEEFPHRHRAMVEVDDPALRDRLASTLQGTRGTLDEFVRVMVYEPDRVEMHVKADLPALVVLADTYFPGWTARVDGVDVPLLRTNRAMRGVLVPAGAHVVEMSYRSKPILLGGVISLASALVWLWLTVRDWWR